MEPGEKIQGVTLCRSLAVTAVAVAIFSCGALIGWGEFQKQYQENESHLEQRERIVLEKLNLTHHRTGELARQESVTKQRAAKLERSEQDAAQAVWVAQAKADSAAVVARHARDLEQLSHKRLTEAETLRQQALLAAAAADARVAVLQKNQAATKDRLDQCQTEFKAACADSNRWRSTAEQLRSQSRNLKNEQARLEDQLKRSTRSFDDLEDDLDDALDEVDDLETDLHRLKCEYEAACRKIRQLEGELRDARKN